MQVTWLQSPSHSGHLERFQNRTSPGFGAPQLAAVEQGTGSNRALFWRGASGGAGGQSSASSRPLERNITPERGWPGRWLAADPAARCDRQPAFLVGDRFWSAGGLGGAWSIRPGG